MPAARSDIPLGKELGDPSEQTRHMGFRCRCRDDQRIGPVTDAADIDDDDIHGSMVGEQLTKHRSIVDDALTWGHIG